MKYVTRFVLAFAVLGGLHGCATDYQKSGLTGGYNDLQLKDGVWRIGYAGNGFTTYETVQTYWLEHCADLALSKGYDGFEILSDMHLTMTIPVEDDDASPLKKVHTVYTPVYVPGGNVAKPQLIGDIRVLHGDVGDAPPKRYNAQALKKRLDSVVNGKKCDGGNVCPHVHDYVYGSPDTSG